MALLRRKREVVLAGEGTMSRSEVAVLQALVDVVREHPEARFPHYREVAGRVQMPEKTVRNILYRLRKKYRWCLEFMSDYQKYQRRLSATGMLRRYL